MFLEMDLIFFNDVIYCNLYCKYCPYRVLGEVSRFVFKEGGAGSSSCHIIQCLSSQSTHTHTGCRFCRNDLKKKHFKKNTFKKKGI